MPALDRRKARQPGKPSVVATAFMAFAGLAATLSIAPNALARSLASPPPETGRMFLDKCRISDGQEDKFWLGVCYGYIYSRIDRLSKDQGHALFQKRLAYNEKHGPEAYDLPTVVFRALQQKNLYQDIKKKVGKSYLSSEDVLDYIILEIIYTERGL